MKAAAVRNPILILLLALFMLGVSSLAHAQQQPFMPTVPIRIPAGTRGMQPNLALVYTPSGGNGLLGVGWALSGIPTITRVNHGTGINFGFPEYNAFCDRAPVGCVDTYAHSEVGVLVPQSDGTYRSKKESFMRFEVSSTCATPVRFSVVEENPCSWTVTDRSGTKYFYGDTPDSRLVVPDGVGVKIWALSRVQDLFGNYWSVTYNPDVSIDRSIGELTPNVITYTQGPGLNTYRTVEFSYDTTRTDHDWGFYSSRGYVQALARRLTGIQIKSAGVLLREYVLSYEYGTTSGVQGRSRLRSIQEQDAAGNALPAQVFTYEQGLPGFTAAYWGDSGSPATALGQSALMLTGDFNGDGKTDFAYVYQTSANKIGFRVRLSGGPSGSDEWAPPDAGPWLAPLKQWGTFLTGDFDGDGRTDIAFVHSIDGATNCDSSNPNCDKGAIDVYRSVGFAFVKWPSFPCRFPGGSNWPLWGTWMTGDFNGDGKTDIGFYGVWTTYARGTIAPTVSAYYGGTSSLALMGELQWTGLPYYECDPSCQIQCPPLFPDLPPGPELCCPVGCPTWDRNWQEHATVLTGDFDGDGRTDIMVITDGGPARYRGGPSTMVFMQIRSTDAGFDSITTDPFISKDFPTWKCGTSWQQCGTFLSIDFNGDGKTDIAYLSQNFPDWTDALATKVATDIFFSTGSGMVRAPRVSLQENWHGGRSWQDSGTFLKGDFDGDGKADLAYLWNNAGQIQIDVALGSQSDAFLLHDWVRWFSPGSIPWFSGTAGASWQTVAAVQTGDFDGQGKMDISYAYLDLGSNVWRYVNLSNSLDHPLPPDLLTDVNNGIGGNQHVEYVSAPNFPGAITPWNANMMAPNAPNTSPQILVKSVRVYDGRGGNYTTNYSYENAQILPGPINQQRNMGFQKIIATDAQTGQSIETQYYQELGLEGQLSKVIVRNGAGQYMRHLSYSHTVVNPAQGTEFVETRHEQDNVLEQASSLNSPAYVRDTYYSYDPAGNINVQQTHAQGLHELDIVTNYNLDWNNWILDQLTDRTVSWRGVQLQRTGYTWTNNNVTSIDNWLDTEDRSIVSWMSYDANGRLTSTTEPSTTDGLLRRTTITAYDDTFHVYPKIITDAKGFTTQRTYTAEGELATFTDENNEVTTYEYDGLGRRTKKTRADGGITIYNYNLTDNPSTQYTETLTQVDTSNSISEKSYFDGSGFVYRSERTGDTGPICVFRRKDSAGRVEAVSNPTFNCSHGGDAFTTIAYEAAGRPDTITTPDNRFTIYTYEANNSHFPCPYGRLEHVFDANSRQTTRCIDSRERTVSVTDPLGQVTTYGYDTLGRIANVSLPGGMSSTIRFDSLGRKFSLNDSQVGVTNYTYYDNGNLKSTTTGDAELTSYKTVTYNYDALNRVTTKTVSDSQAGSEGPITFAYDEEGHTDAIGRLTTVTGNNGLTTQYSYTPLGQPKVVSRHIVNSWTGTTDNFTETFTYDVGGRLTRLQYPDGSIANYYYTLGGNLQRVDLNGVTRATWRNYDAFGAPRIVQYQNEVATVYTFDDMHHLTGLITGKRPFSEPDVYQNLTFDWYSAQTPTNGVVLGKIQDNRTSTVIDGVDTNETQTYWYDPLYRLASASGVWGTRTYSYDTNNSGVGIGNPNSFGGITQRTLTFSGTKLTAASDSAGWSVSGIGYDTSGNMINKTVTSAGTTTKWNYNWTAENRLASTTYAQPSAGATTTMLYDEAGQRFMKHHHTDYGFASPDETTTYIDKAYEKWSSGSSTTPDKHTLHLFGNGQLIMSWTRQGSIQTAFNEETDWRTDIAASAMDGESTREVLRGTAPGLGTFFYHRNHINSSAVITDLKGNEVSRMVYMPFGELAQNNSSGSDVVTDKYTGQVSDPETGLYYYNARHYDPMIGRFLSADLVLGSLLNAQSYNRYAYTRNNPITNTDSTGLCPDYDPACISQVPGGGGGGWIDNVIGAASWLFGFNWLGGSDDSGPSGPKPSAPPMVTADIPSTPLNVDQSSSGNPNGTLSRVQAINELAALKVRMASQRITPEAINYRAARGRLAVFGNMEFAGRNITDHPEEFQRDVLNYTFFAEAMLLTGGLGTGMITLSELGIGGAAMLGGGTPLAVGKIGNELKPGVFYSGWGSGTTDAVVNKYMALRDLGQPLTGTTLAAEMRALEAAGAKINWAMPSAQFAADIGIKGGLARVVLGNVPGAQSVWTLTERPILNFFGIPIKYHLRVLP